jgi:hypothetical protein
MLNAMLCSAADVGDGDVRRAERLGGDADGAGYVLFPGEITCHADGLAALGCDRLDRLGDRVLMLGQGGHHDPTSLEGEQFSRRPSHAHAASGHEGDSSGNSQVHLSNLSRVPLRAVKLSPAAPAAPAAPAHRCAR